MEIDVKYRDSTNQLAAYREQIAELRRKMREVQAAIEPDPVANYVLATPSGPRSLADLFGDRRDLFVIFNMGTSCVYCTLWADGFNGLYPHIADRAAFVVASPDPPELQQRFAAGRGWQFPMVSHRDTTFAAEMGYRSDDGRWKPGVSAFRHDGARILRVADTGLQPGDDFCTLWHLLDLLPEGPADWHPKYSYA